MNDLLVGLALALVFEGLLWALAPDLGRRMLADLSEMPDGRLKAVAWCMVGLGGLLVWAIRG